MNESQETMSIFSSPLPRVFTPQRVQIQDVEYLRHFGSLAIPQHSPTRDMVLDRENFQNGMSAFNSYLQQEEMEMREFVPSQPYFDQSILDNYPTFKNVEEYLQTSFVPIHDNFSALFHFSALCKTTINNMLATSAQNDEAVLKHLNSVWYTLEQVLGYSKDNFAICNHDFQQFRELFNTLVENQLPNQFGDLREKLKEAFINAELRFTNLESVLNEHNQKFREASDFCSKLRRDIDQARKDFSHGSNEPGMLLQASLVDVNQNIRDLHENFQHNSRSLSQLREKFAILENTSIPRSEFVDLQQKVAKMENIFGHLSSFREEVNTTIQNVESRLHSRHEVFQTQFDDFLGRLSVLECEIAKCKSRLDNPACGDSQKTIVGEELTAWSTRMHRTVFELLNKVQQVDVLTSTHERQLQALTSQPSHSSSSALVPHVQGLHPDFSVEIAKVNQLEQLFQRLVSQVSSCEDNAHDIALVRDSLDCLKKEVHSKFQLLDHKISSEVALIRNPPKPSTVFDSFGPRSHTAPGSQFGNTPYPQGASQSHPMEVAGRSSLDLVSQPKDMRLVGQQAQNSAFQSFPSGSQPMGLAVGQSPVGQYPKGPVQHAVGTGNAVGPVTVLSNHAVGSVGEYPQGSAQFKVCVKILQAQSLSAWECRT